MHKIQRKFLFFLIGLIGIILMLNVVSLQLLKKFGYRQFKQDEILEQQDSINYLFIGSSRLNRDVIQDSIPGSFKYFGSTETNPYHYYRFEHALNEKDSAIGYTVIAAETGMLAFNELPILYLGIYWRQYIDVWDFAMHSGDPMRYLAIGAKMKTMPFYQLPATGLMLLDVLEEREAWRNIQEEDIMEYSWFERQLITNYMILRHVQYARMTTELGEHYFKKIVELSKDKQHPVIFLKYPLTDIYQRALEHNFPELIEAHEKMDSLALESPYARIIDLSDLYSNRPTYFFDAHHLNKEGKRDFTTILRDTLQSIRASGWPATGDR